MKITIITSPFGCIPPSALGAVEKLWFSIAEEFKKNGYDTSFIAKQPNTKDNEIGGNTYIKGYARTGSLTKDLILDFIYSWKALRCVSKTDVLVLNTFWTPILYRLFKNKTRLTVYNVARFPKHQFGLYSNIDRLACVSYPVLKELIRQSPKTKKQAVVIPNPIDTEAFNYQEKKEKKNIVICYAGRIHPEKGIDILIAAFKQLNKKYDNLSLKLIGPTETAEGGGGLLYIDRLNNMLQEGNINWVAPIKDSIQLSQAMADSDIFCYPSVAEKGETFGVAPLEAMALGIPTIVSDLDCFKDFIINKENGLVFNHRSTNNIEELAKCLEHLITNKPYRKLLGKNGATAAKNNFSVKQIADLYLSDFNSSIINKYGKDTI